MSTGLLDRVRARLAQKPGIPTQAEVAAVRPELGVVVEVGPIVGVRLDRANKVDYRPVRALGKIDTAIELGGFVGVSRTGVVTSDYDVLTARVAYLRDVSAPQAIKAGDMVDVVWSDGQLSLSLQARANGPAAVGEAVVLVNLASKKVFEAVATGPVQAAMGPGVRPARTPGLRYASR